MDPMLEHLEDEEDWELYDNLVDNGGRKWKGTLDIIECSRDYPCHCYNGIFEPELGEKGLDCGGPCPKCEISVPWHCYNRKQDFDETGIDCGGSCPQRCEDLPPCANCKKDAGELMVDCGGTCAPCEDVQNEKTITKTSQLLPEVVAYKKITAKDATTIASGKKVSFITEEDGSIILLPGFKAENGSKFTTQRMEDLSGFNRICGEICRIEYISTEHSFGSILTMYNLFNAVEIKYRIHDLESGLEVYKNTLNISRNGSFKLWDLETGTNNPTGHVWYYIVYEVFYCNGAYYGDTQRFLVKYKSSKSIDDAPDAPAPTLSPPANSITLQDENPAPNFVVIPNPNPGTFQIETNFPLSDIDHLKITNMPGATVYETQNLFSNTIQLPAFASGQHFVIVMLKDGTVLTQKMMLQR